MLANLTFNKPMKTLLSVAAVLSFGLMAGCASKASDSTNITAVSTNQPQSTAAVTNSPDSQSTNAAEPLDVNDISFLWPVPKTKEDADGLISLADLDSDGPIMPPAIFKAIME